MRSCVVVANSGKSLRQRSQPGSKESQTNHSTQASTDFTSTHSAQTVCDHKHRILMVGGALGGGVMGGVRSWEGVHHRGRLVMPAALPDFGTKAET